MKVYTYSPETLYEDSLDSADGKAEGRIVTWSD